MKFRAVLLAALVAAAKGPGPGMADISISSPSRSRTRRPVTTISIWLTRSLEMYRALRQIGAPVEMVQYPRDNHGPLSGAINGSAVPEKWHGFDARQRIVKFIRAAFEKAPIP